MIFFFANWNRDYPLPQDPSCRLQQGMVVSSIASDRRVSFRDIY